MVAPMTNLGTYMFTNPTVVRLHIKMHGFYGNSHGKPWHRRAYKPYSCSIARENAWMLRQQPYRRVRMYAKRSSEQPRKAQNSPEQPRAAQTNPEQPRTGQNPPEQARTAQNSPEQPRTNQNSPEQPRTAQNSPEQRRTSEGSPEQPRTSQNSPE